MLMTVTGQYGNDCWYTIQHLTVINTDFKSLEVLWLNTSKIPTFFFILASTGQKSKQSVKNQVFLLNMDRNWRIAKIYFIQKNESSITKKNQLQWLRLWHRFSEHSLLKKSNSFLKLRWISYEFCKNFMDISWLLGQFSGHFAWFWLGIRPRRRSPWFVYENLSIHQKYEYGIKHWYFSW